MPELVHFDRYPMEIEGAHTINMYHRSKPIVQVLSNDMANIQQYQRDGYSTSYIFQAYPKGMYRADGNLVVVANESEEKQLRSVGYGDKPPAKKSWDNRQPTPGFQIGEHHLKFLQHCGFEFDAIQQARDWFYALPEAPQAEFLEDAENWMPESEEVKRGPGRPRKDG
jgi:hypothetical protein